MHFLADQLADGLMSRSSTNIVYFKTLATLKLVVRGREIPQALITESKFSHILNQTVYLYI